MNLMWQKVSPKWFKNNCSIISVLYEYDKLRSSGWQLEPMRVLQDPIIMEIVGIRLFLVYFWQMESVMVYVCGLPSVDPRVF